MKKKDNTINKKISKTQIAKDAGISRSSLYYKAKRDEFDLEMKKQIIIILGLNPSYGHKRIALEFPLNKKRILRVMKKYNIKPYRQQPKSPKKPEDYGKPKAKWENGFQESFYDKFKVDLGYVQRFETVEELIEEIYQTIYYYNNTRMHTSIKMASVSFRQNYEVRLLRLTV